MKKVIVMLAMSLLVVTSCKKEDIEPIDENPKSALFLVGVKYEDTTTVELDSKIIIGNRSKYPIDLTDHTVEYFQGGYEAKVILEGGIIYPGGTFDVLASTMSYSPGLEPKPIIEKKSYKLYIRIRYNSAVIYDSSDPE